MGLRLVVFRNWGISAALDAWGERLSFLVVDGRGWGAERGCQLGGVEVSLSVSEFWMGFSDFFSGAWYGGLSYKIFLSVWTFLKL